MDRSFSVKILTRERKVYDGPAVSLVAPGRLGYLGILKDHAPLVTPLEPGTIFISGADGKTSALKNEGAGFLEVMKNLVTVVAEKLTS